jgi:hypothetical protein
MNLLASSSYTELVLVWTIPFILVIFGWLIDKRRYPHQNALVT